MRYLSSEFDPSTRRPLMDRLPVLVKSVLRAPEPEYALLTTLALSAHTTVNRNLEGDTISEYGLEVREHFDSVSGLENADVDELLSQGNSCKS